MNIHLLDEHSTQFQIALQDFEAQFRYPLGENKTFSISHGADYSAFYRSMGVAYCLIAEDENQVIGTFCCALRETNENKTIAYLGDLKVSKHKQNTSVYYRLAENMFKLIQEKTDTAIAVVMDGTLKTPEHYTGKLGLPKFYEINKYVILRVNTEINSSEPSIAVVNNEKGEQIYYNIANKSYLKCSLENLRSNVNPVWLSSNNKDACGKIEDTEKVKRLFSSDSEELRSAHLSHFAFINREAAYELILAALCTAKEKGFAHLFITLSENEYADLLSNLSSLDYEIAMATLYSNQKVLNFELQFNSAEI